MGSFLLCPPTSSPPWPTLFTQPHKTETHVYRHSHTHTHSFTSSCLPFTHSLSLTHSSPFFSHTHTNTRLPFTHTHSRPNYASAFFEKRRGGNALVSVERPLRALRQPSERFKRIDVHLLNFLTIRRNYGERRRPPWL